MGPDTICPDAKEPLGFNGVTYLQAPTKEAVTYTLGKLLVHPGKDVLCLYSFQQTLPFNPASGTNLACFPVARPRPLYYSYVLFFI